MHVVGQLCAVGLLRAAAREEQQAEKQGRVVCERCFFSAEGPYQSIHHVCPIYLMLIAKGSGTRRVTNTLLCTSISNALETKLLISTKKQHDHHIVVINTMVYNHGRTQQATLGVPDAHAHEVHTRQTTGHVVGIARDSPSL